MYLNTLKHSHIELDSLNKIGSLLVILVVLYIIKLVYKESDLLQSMIKYY